MKGRMIDTVLEKKIWFFEKCLSLYGFLRFPIQSFKNVWTSLKKLFLFSKKTIQYFKFVDAVFKKCT